MSKFIFDESQNIFNIENAMTILKCQWNIGGGGSYRLNNRFVTLEYRDKVSIADANSKILGVSIPDSTFLGSSSSNLYCVVQTLGKCWVDAGDDDLYSGAKVISDNDGKAVLSPNDVGYQVIEFDRDEMKALILLESNCDVLQKISSDVNKYNRFDTLVGTVIYNEKLYGAGYLSNSREKIYFSLPHSKYIDINKTYRVSVVSGEIKVRQNGNYILGSASELFTLTNSNVSFTVNDSVINMVLTPGSISNSAVNNDVVGIELKDLVLNVTES